MRKLILAVLAATTMTTACATDTAAHAKPGFFTHVHDGRLWVLKEGDKDIEIVSQNKEPKVVVTRIAAGPNNMTIKSNSAEVIDAYLASR